MKEKRYSITREKVVAAARSFIGFRYQHQSRGENNAIDCVGLLVLMGEKIKHPDIQDLPDYRRVPSASTLMEYLKRNLREIPLEKLNVGDVVLMKMGGMKPRHTAIITNLETDYERGVSPMLIHAVSNGIYHGVMEQPVKMYRAGFTNAFRIRGIKN